MIYDRTQADIDTALFFRKRLQEGESLTKAEIEALERGTLTINTLNRIEQKQAELKEIFNSLGYWNTNGIEIEEWSYTGFFRQEDFDRILQNLEILKSAYYVYSATPNVPNANYRQFNTINAVEHILNDLQLMVDDMKSRYRICGATECGE